MNAKEARELSKHSQITKKDITTWKQIVDNRIEKAAEFGHFSCSNIFAKHGNIPDASLETIETITEYLIEDEYIVTKSNNDSYAINVSWKS